MKIVAGMGSVEDYEKIVSAGADEIFCGFVPNSWNIKYGNVLPLNRREVLFYHVQIGTYEDMAILMKKVQKFKVPVTVAFNALFYTKRQLQDVLDIIKRLIEIGFSDFIVADVNLIRKLFEEKLSCNIHISGELGEWNSETMKFFMEEFESDKTKISRTIFHRKNEIKDMESCILTGKNNGFCAEYEAFCMNERCQYTGGFCNSLHADELVHICMLPYKTSFDISDYDNEDEAMDEYQPGETGCGLCALPELKKAGITHLKVVGRGESVDCMVKDIEALRKAIEMLENYNEEEFSKKVIEEVMKGSCNKNCYYKKWL